MTRSFSFGAEQKGTVDDPSPRKKADKKHAKSSSTGDQTRRVQTPRVQTPRTPRKLSSSRSYRTLRMKEELTNEQIWTESMFSVEDTLRAKNELADKLAAQSNYQKID